MKCNYFKTMLGAALLSSCTVTPPKKPNVVFILVDDISHFTLPIYGADSVAGFTGKMPMRKVNTPNIDKLRSQGILCTNAYAHALSEPTRVAFLTGMNNGRNFLAPKAMHESQITISDEFKRNGYATGMYGKWKQTRGTKDTHAREYISKFGWDEYACHDVVGEDQRYVNPDLIVNGKAVDYRKRTDLDPDTNRRWYGPDIFNRMAIDFVEKNKENPFFLYYPMVLIHDEHRPTPNTMPTTEFDTMDEKRTYDKREYIVDMIEYTDFLVGKLVDKIDELGIRENTLIVLMGDNGTKEYVEVRMKNGETHFGEKGAMNYSGEQVPLIFSQPKTLQEGGEYTGIIDITDMFPTIAESVEMEIENSEKIDGVSLWKQLIGDEKKPHREYIYKWYNANRKQTDMSLVARYAQTADHKYYAPHDVYPEGRFFDLQEDPKERSGERGKRVGWEKYFYAGFDIAGIEGEDLEAMRKLQEVTEAHTYTPVKSIKIESEGITMSVGENEELDHEVFPSNATRNNVIWESSNPEIVSVDKFGKLIAHAKGNATITLYSWDDAWPVANGRKGGYLKNGLNDTIAITVN